MPLGIKTPPPRDVESSETEHAPSTLQDVVLPINSLLSPSPTSSQTTHNSYAATTAATCPEVHEEAQAETPASAPRKFISNGDIRGLFETPRTKPIMERYYKVIRRIHLLFVLGVLGAFFQLSHFNLEEAWNNFRNPIALQSKTHIPYVVIFVFYVSGTVARNPAKRLDIGSWVKRKGWVLSPPIPSPAVLEQLERKRLANLGQLDETPPTVSERPPSRTLLSAAQEAHLILPATMFLPGLPYITSMWAMFWAWDLCRSVSQIEDSAGETSQFLIMVIVSDSIVLILATIYITVMVLIGKRVALLLDHEQMLKQSATNAYRDIVEDINNSEA